MDRRRGTGSALSARWGVPRRSESRIARLRYGHDFRRLDLDLGVEHDRCPRPTELERIGPHRGHLVWVDVYHRCERDGRPDYDLALYAVDWDNRHRSEQIQVTSAATGAVLSTWTLSSFTNGEYLQWAITGSVVITVTALAGPTPSSVGCSSTRPLHDQHRRPGGHHDARQLDRHLRRQGYDIEGGASSLPSYATVSVSGASTWNWASSTTDPRALEAPGGSGSSAACWYSAELHDRRGPDRRPDARPDVLRGRLGQHGPDRTDPGHRAATGAVLDTQTVSGFNGGEYLEWAVSGNIEIRVTNLSPANAVVSGFFSPPRRPPPPPSPVQEDTTTQGNWQGTYGSDGKVIEGGVSSRPRMRR